MGLVTIGAAEIAELGTSVALYGAIHVEPIADEVFDMIVAITTLIHELYP